MFIVDFHKIQQAIVNIIFNVNFLVFSMLLGVIGYIDDVNSFKKHKIDRTVVKTRKETKTLFFLIKIPHKSCKF